MKKNPMIVLIVFFTIVAWCVLLPLKIQYEKEKEARQLEALSKRNWKEFTHDRGWDIDVNILTYYDTMEEALQKTKMNLFSKSPYTRNVDEEILRMENDEYGMLFYLSFLDEDNGAIMATKFKTREEDGKRLYALFIIEPIEGKRNAKTLGTFEDVIRSQLKINDYDSVNGIDKDKRFIWGSSVYKEAYDLTVEGQKPTGIIPYDFLGETEYFWYFEDLKSTKPGAALEFKVGDE